VSSSSSQCRRCGSEERYKDGRCIACSRVTNLRWKKNNPQKHLKGSVHWTAAHPDARKKSSARYSRLNAAKISQTRKLWRLTHPDRHAAHENKRRALKAGVDGSYSKYEWLVLCQRYQYRCLCCRRDDVKLTVDHVIPLTRGGSNNIDNIQPLCGLCNSKKATAVIDYRVAGEGLTTGPELRQEPQGAHCYQTGSLGLSRGSPQGKAG